ncbi:MAG: peptidyl-prolyl cis-trans isomerase [Alphaproteobacteria bacterium]|nr:peptidyl-prolyl cis-trans isomerase [Alphaproteobacteria bacterium]
MIGKIRSIQDSWVMKLILILTALSFMSLFGVSGYYATAANNKPVIKVDDIEITQSQIMNELNNELQKAKSLFGENLDVNEDIRNALLQGLVQKELSNAILQKTAQDNNVYISDELIKKIISSQPEFMDENGKFSVQRMRRILASVGMSEQEYIQSLRRDIEKIHLVYNMVDGVTVPEFMADYQYKLDNQKKVFKFINIDPEQMKIDRKISQDEIEQYYNDFAAQFIEPENRDVSFISISSADAAGKVLISDEDVKAYYDENIKQFEVPESRNILQMVFSNKDDADKAYAQLKNGADFYAVAKKEANQDKAATELGFVEKDMLIGNMGDVMFSLKKGEISEPEESEYGWHIMKVTDIRPMQKTSWEKAKAKIVEVLRREQSDEAAGDLIAKIEDEAGAGKSLAEIAKGLNVPLLKVEGLQEDGKAESMPKSFEKLVASPDFIDAAFSYNQDETSQAVETDDGFVFVNVDKVTEPRQKAMDEVVPEIEKIWAGNEKNAIAQEVVNDVLHDVENGDKIEDVARRFGLKLQTTAPLKKSDTFDGFSALQMQELFRENIGTPKVIGDDMRQVIVVPAKVINSSDKLTESEKKDILRKAQFETSQEMAQQLINDYGTNYRIKIKYKAIGIID